MYAANPPTREINQEQAVAQLAALGYERGDAVYMRYLHPVTKKSIKASKLDFAEANRYQSQGFDAYFVVNGGGDKDSDVTKCLAIFYEHDNLEKSIQLGLWKTLGLPEPTTQIDTGGKSIHSYWVFTTPISPKLWKVLQTYFLEFSGGDPAIKNPSRVMRLAGSWYMKGENPGANRATIVSHSGKTYSYEELRAIIPQKPEEPPLLQPLPLAQYEGISVLVSESIPLEFCLSQGSRTLLQSGAGDGGRNNNGTKLARDLLGTATYLQSIGQQFDGDPWQLFLDYCNRCTQGNGWNESEWQSIWKSAEGDRPAPSCKADGVDNCIRGWYWNNHIKSNQQGRHGSTLKGIRTGSLAPTVSDIPLIDRVREITSLRLSAPDLKAAFIDLAKSTKCQLRDIEQLADAIEVESDFQAESAQAQLNLPDILRNHNQELNPATYLWGDEGRLALAMSTTVAAMPTSAAMIFSTFIAASASRIGTSSRIVIKASAGYVQACIFWVAVVSRSGTLKTPAQRVAIDPLVNLEIAAKKAHAQTTKEYEAARKNLKKGDESPEEPPPRKRFLTKDSTLETLERIHSDNPRGLLYYRDELARMSKSQNAFKPSGKGADQEAELDQWNGSALIVDRQEREICLDKTAISRTGSIQYEIMQKLAGDHEDSNGNLARWLLCAVKAPPRFLHFDDCPDTGIVSLLESLYKNLAMLPARDYLIDTDSQTIFKTWQNRLVAAEIEENHPGLKLVYPKIEAYTARLALWLHCVNAILAGETPAPSIPGSTMQKAVKLASFFLGQAKLVYAVNSPQSGLTGRLLKLHQFAEGKKKGITARFIQSNLRCFRKTPAAEIVRDCQSLADGGYFRRDGDTFFFNADSADTLLTVASATTTPIDKVFQDIADIADIADTSEKTTNPTAPIEPRMDWEVYSTSTFVSNVSSVSNFSENLTGTGAGTADSTVSKASATVSKASAATPNEREAQDRTERRILDLLKTIAPIGMEAEELEEELGFGNSVHSALGRLLDKHLIASRPSKTNQLEAVYFCPKDFDGSDTPPTPSAPNIQKADSNESNAQDFAEKTFDELLDAWEKEFGSISSVVTTEVDSESALATCLPSTTTVKTTLTRAKETVEASTPPNPILEQQVELDFAAQPERSASGETIEVWHRGRWEPALLLQAPNAHPDPTKRTTGWRVKILASALEQYFWSPSEIRGATS